jgi:hypothetical protein
MAAGGDGRKPHESPYKKNKRIKMTSGQSYFFPRTSDKSSIFTHSTNRTCGD